MVKKKHIILALCITVLFVSQSNIVQASSREEYSIKSGMYIKGIESNLYVDIYNFINNTGQYSRKITEAGLENVLFVHQSGKGASLYSILNNSSEIPLEEVLQYLTQDQFENTYTIASTGEKISPKVGLYVNDIYIRDNKIIIDFSGTPLQQKPNFNELEIIDITDNSMREVLFSEENITWNETTKQVTITLKDFFNNYSEETLTLAIMYNGKFTPFKFNATIYGTFEKVSSENILPILLTDNIEIEPNYYILPAILNEYMDVLQREYPEFLVNIKNAWPNDDDDDTKHEKIAVFLEDVKIKVQSYGEVTEDNFDRIMYNAFKDTVILRKHKDFRNALLESYGDQIDYSEKYRELHPDLIPLSEGIKSSVLNNSFILLFDTEGKDVNLINNLEEKLLKTMLSENIIPSSVKYEVQENEYVHIDPNNELYFNRLIEREGITQIDIKEVDGEQINSNKSLILKIRPYLNNAILTTSKTTDYDALTKKVRIYDESNNIIEDAIEEVYILNETTGEVTKQEVDVDQKINYIYISNNNPKMDYMVYFKTISDKWYKISIRTDMFGDGYLINE